MGGRRLAMIEGQAVPVADLASLIGMSAKGVGPWVILGVAEQQGYAARDLARAIASKLTRSGR